MFIFYYKIQILFYISCFMLGIFFLFKNLILQISYFFNKKLMKIFMDVYKFL